MEVILVEEFSSLGSAGDVVDVARGYARNFLIPRKIAVEVNRQNRKMVEHRLAAIASKRRKAKEEAQQLADKVKSLSLSFVLKSGGEAGKSFGSITVKELAESLTQQGFEVDKRRIRLDTQVKTAGEYSAIVRLHTEVSIDLPFIVTVEEVKAVASSEDEPKKGRRGSRGRKPRADAAGEASDSASEAKEA